MTRLSLATLPDAAPALMRPAYDPAAVSIGAVHFGPGAFHRAHQAYFIDRLLAFDPTRAISAVALKSPGVRDALAPQDGLYVLAELDETPALHAITAIRELLVAAEAPAAVAARLADPRTRLVTSTVTEKGYCLNGAGELDLDHSEIRADLLGDHPPQTLIGWLARGLELRRAAGVSPFLTVPCDNLSDNGVKLARAVETFARQTDPSLADWIADQARFARSMVDSITPATDDALRVRVEAETGLEDAWPIQRESFVQWVVEEMDGAPAPDWARMGVILTRDVAAFDRAKLRLLNGPHSTLAYVGLLAGFETVAEAMADPILSAFVARLMREDIVPSLRAPAGFDLHDYSNAILKRFRNRFIRHNLSQIAGDGSQKLPFRLIAVVGEAVAAGRPLDRLAVPLAAWMRFVVRQSRAGVALVDPMAARLAELGQAANGDAAHDVALFLSLDSVFARDLAAHAGWIKALRTAYARLGENTLNALAA
jgi:fructuronate reductase